MIDLLRIWTPETFLAMMPFYFISLEYLGVLMLTATISPLVGLCIGRKLARLLGRMVRKVR